MFSRDFDPDKYLGEYVTEVVTAAKRDPKDYENGTGHVQGSVYSVRGFDPGFMLCMKDESTGMLKVFLCDNGYSVTYGSDVLETRLHASELLTSVVYERRASYDNGYGECFRISAEEPAVSGFLKALDEGVWCVPYETEEEMETLYNKGDVHITLMLGDVGVKLMVLDGGYVCFRGMGFGGYCIGIDTEETAPLMELIEKNVGEPVENTGETRGFRLGDAKKQPVYGGFIPEYIPEGMRFVYCFFHYKVDPKTRKTLDITGMDLCYESEAGEDSYIDLSFTGPEAREPYLGDGEEDDPDITDPFIPIGELTEDDLRLVLNDPECVVYDACVFEGDVFVRLAAGNVSPEDIVKVLRSCFGR